MQKLTEETYIFSYLGILSNWAAHLRCYTFLGILREYLKNSKCFKRLIKFWGDGMIREKFSMLSGIAVFSLQLLRMSVFWQNLQTHAAAFLVCLIFFKFQIVRKIFLRNILGQHGMFRVCLQQRQVNSEILT